MSEKNPPNKMKPRSGLVTDGLERAPARGMLLVFQCNLELFQFLMEFQWDMKECISH